jgi:peptide/nickel transport system substrate-binding protein
MVRRLSASLIVLLLATGLLTLGSGGQTGAAAASDTLVIAKDISDIHTPDPNKSYDISGVFLQFPIYSRLVKQEAPDLGTIKPDLAASWSINPNATEMTFKLRDAKFGDGTPVTSEDVRFSLLRAKNLKGYGAFLADPLKSVDVVDSKTVRVTLTDPNAAFLATLTAGVFSIVEAKVVRAAGGVETPGADKLDKAEQMFFKQSVGTAPYRLVSYVRESQIVMERNDRYYGPAPFFKTVIIKHVKEPATQSFMVQRGDADIALDMSINQVNAIRGKPGLQFFKDPSAWTTYLGMKTTIKPWTDPRVREAAKYAIDYDGLINGVLHGTARQLGSIMMPGLLGFPESLNQQLLYKQDLNKARALLKEAGVGTVHVDFVWGLGFAYGSATADQIAQKIRADLQRVGLILDPKPVQSGILLTTARTGKPPTILNTWYPDYFDPDNFTYFASGFVARRFNWEDAAGKKDAEQAAATGDVATRARLYEDYNRRIAAPTSPYVFLVQPYAVVPARDNLTGYHFHPFFFLQLDSLRRK